MTRRQSRGPMLKNRLVGVGTEAPDQLLSNPANWRTHGDAQANELEKVLETVGWVQRIIVNRRTGNVVDGHLRVMLALQRNEDAVPVSYIDVSPSEEKLILACLDPLAALAGRDDEKLAELKEEVIQEFPEAELDFDVLHSAPRKRTKGLTHDVRACTCCQKGCKPGCGCWEGEE